MQMWTRKGIYVLVIHVFVSEMGKHFERTIRMAIWILIFFGFVSCKAHTGNEPSTNKEEVGRAYYVSANGDDQGDGTLLRPFQTLSRLLSVKFRAGDSILLEGGNVFAGTILLNDIASVGNKVFILTSYGENSAVIESGNREAISINNCRNVTVSDLTIKGAGRKEGNTTSGVSIFHCEDLTVARLDISGFQKSGLAIINSSNVLISNVVAHANGYAGISVHGENYMKSDCRNIRIVDCRAENNPGDPSNLKNHSGNGIVVSQCRNVLIRSCTATNNGWDMPRKGNGPVGIWAWDADSVVIESCLSYRNRTAPHADDGGGFDFDGGVTNSIIQYCLSYENAGSGYGLFEYNGAGAWFNNTVRYNISIDDGLLSAASSAIYIWNMSDSFKLKDCFIYNNTIVNRNHAAVNFSSTSVNENLRFYNNILVGRKQIIIGDDTAARYLGNAWWSIMDKFNFNTNTDFRLWTTTSGQEYLNGQLLGTNIDPGFTNLTIGDLTSANQLKSFMKLRSVGSILTGNGIDLRGIPGLNPGVTDFNGNRIVFKGIGASF